VKLEEQLLHMKTMSIAQDRQIEIRDTQIKALVKQIQELRNGKK
jgi:hypothetical protein